MATSAASAAALSMSGGAEPPASCLHHAQLNQWPASDRPSILIKYFDAKGVMETSRITMVLGGLPFSETRWPLDVTKMAAGLGSAAPEYMAAKEAGELDANLGRGPVVVVAGEHVLSQSRTIERYLARQLGMMGRDELAAAHIDAFTEHLRDLKEKFQKVRATTSLADKEAGLTAFYSRTLPEFMLHVEKTVPGSLDGPLFGGSLSLADAALFVTFNDYFENKAAAAAALSECPKLQASLAAVERHPAVAEYLATRPDTKF